MVVLAEAALKRHFRKLPLQDLVTASRTSPVTARVDVQLALEKMFSEQFDARSLGVHTQYQHETLSEAENIVVIGYSLPETDYFFHYLYALGAVGSTRIKRFFIFNPEPSVEERFSRLLGPVAQNRMKHFKSTFSESIRPLRDALVQG